MKLRIVLTALVIVATVAPAALAAQPTFERISVDDTFFDEFLSAECGVPVTSHAQGHITGRTFSGSSNVELRTLNVLVTASAGDNTYQFRDVGADHVTAKKDGSTTLSIVGQIPFAFIGVLKIDLVTGEVIHEPGHSIVGRLDDACAALTA